MNGRSSLSFAVAYPGPTAAEPRPWSSRSGGPEGSWVSGRARWISSSSAGFLPAGLPAPRGRPVLAYRSEVEPALTEWSRKIGWLAMSRLGIALGWIEVMMQVLRETPEFWTNAGGYPVWMRDGAREVFYPLLFLSVANLAGLVWILLSPPARSWPVLRRQLSWVAAIVVLLLVTVAIGVWDE